jgi:parallel beta-helix repeat protein
MTTYFVATNGNDNNSGSQSLPFLTVRHAVPLLVPGDTLFIRGGTYNEALRTGSTFIPSGTSFTNAITIAGFQLENPTLTGDGVAVIDFSNDVANKSFIIFKDFRIDALPHDGNPIPVFVGIGNHHIRFQHMDIMSGYTGIGTTSFGASAFSGGANSIEVLNCDIHECQSYGFYVRGSDWIIDRNTIHGNGGYGIQIYQSGANTVSRNRVSNNYIYNNGTAFIELTYGFVLSSGSDNIAYNNIVRSHVRGGGIQLAYYNGGVNNRLYNNTSYGNDGAGIEIYDSAPGSIVQNNICFNNNAIQQIQNNGAINVIVDHNFTSDPAFVDTVNNNFNLQSTSGAIGFGIDLSSLFTTDYAGNVRTLPFDAGAYEFVSIITPIPITCDDSLPWVRLSTGVFANTLSMKTITFSPYPARWVCFRALSEVNGNPWTSCAELSVLVSGRQIVPTPPTHLAWDYVQGVLPSVSLAVKFNIYRQTNLAGGFILIGSVDYPTLEYFDTTVGYGNIYDYEITAVSAQNVESTLSNVVEYVPSRVGTVWCFDSEELVGEGPNNGHAIHCIDGLTTTFWHTRWTSNVPGYPHNIIIDLGHPYSINGFTYLPRQDGGINGTVASYEFYVADYFISIGRLMTLPSLQPMLSM